MLNGDEWDMPENGEIVLLAIEHCHNKKRQYIVVKKVDEGDCDFRTLDDKMYGLIAVRHGYL